MRGEMYDCAMFVYSYPLLVINLLCPVVVNIAPTIIICTAIVVKVESNFQGELITFSTGVKRNPW